MTKILYALLLSISFATIVRAQETMRGIVADSATFKPLPYVTVRIKNKNIGTVTDQQGHFAITATRRDTIVLSFIGYKTLEIGLFDWEPSVLLMAENPTMLAPILIEDIRVNDPYHDIFEDEIAQWRAANKKLPFYYSRTKKQKVRVGRLLADNERAKVYIDVVIKNDGLKKELMQMHGLTEAEYYSILADFNAKNHLIMYYLTAGELATLIKSYFASRK